MLAIIEKEEEKAEQYLKNSIYRSTSSIRSGEGNIVTEDDEVGTSKSRVVNASKKQVKYKFPNNLIPDQSAKNLA